MDHLSTIEINDLPAALMRALREHLPAHAEAQHARPALIICALRTENTAPAVPVLRIEVDKPQRLGGILRRARQMVQNPIYYLDDIQLGRYTLCPPEKRLALRANAAEEIILTDRETAILCYLARADGKSASREDLLRDVWHYQEGIDTHTLETHIYRLRQKIEAAPDAPQLIITDAAGYRLHLESNV